MELWRALIVLLQQPVTTDESGEINYPYLHAKGNENKIYAEKKHCSFVALC